LTLHSVYSKITTAGRVTALIFILYDVIDWFRSLLFLS